MSKGFASSRRLAALATGIFLCFGAIGLRLVQLHVLDRDQMLAHAVKVRDSTIPLAAKRGDILDARGDILATSRSLVELAIDPWDFVDYADYLRETRPAEAEAILTAEQHKRFKLAELIGVPYAQIEELYVPGYREVDLEKDLYDDARDGRTKIRWVKLHAGVEESVYEQIQHIAAGPSGEAYDALPKAYRGAPRGLAANRAYYRTYPRDQLAAHVVGFVNKEGVASDGMELFADEYLHGYDGWRESERDGRRRELAEYRRREAPAVDGWDVVLSIDSVVQHTIELELLDIATQYQPDRAVILVTDARDGFLLGLANYPTFDPNRFNESSAEERRNAAVAYEYDPGSTFKVVPAAMALETGAITPSMRFDVSLTSINYQGINRTFIKDDHPILYPVTVHDIISHSSNVGAAQIAMRLGDQGLFDAAHAFGMGEKSGFGFGGEIAGLINPPSKWSAPDITRIPAGYSISVTPMQIHQAMGVFAAGGELLRPQIIREVRDREGKTVFAFGREARRRVVSPTVADEMRRILMRVASRDGTARAAAIDGYQIAGKTGTAQKLIEKRYYSKTQHVGSFSGFFPATDPRLVITVIIDNAHLDGNRRNYGAAVAVPTFQRIAARLIPYLDIKPVTASSSPLLAMEGGRR